MKDEKNTNNKKGLDKVEMWRKVVETVDQETDAEVKMERDGSYKVFSVKRKRA